MAAHRDIVVIERMRRGTVDPRRLGCRRGLAGEVQRRRARRRVERLFKQLRRVVARTGDHRRDRIDKARAGDLDRLWRQILEG
jgi:hypothetical protein